MSAAGPSAVDSGSSSLGFMLRAFRYRNYRLFFGGQIVSLVGTWITTTATSWLVYRLTGSALLLGVVGFASQFPSFLLTPFAGIFVDRWNRHHLLVGTQAASMIISFVLAALTLSSTISIRWLIIVSVFSGIVNAFDMPGRQAFVVTLIEDKKDLGNAIALNSSMFNAARLVGPSVAGVIIALSNEGWCYFIDGVSYLAVIAALLAMRITAAPARTTPHESPVKQFREGWKYTYTSRPIRSIIMLIGLVCLVGVPYTVLMPVFAAEILGGGAHTLGFLMTATGGGALLGALWLASRRTVSGLPRNIAAAGAVFSCGLMAFALSRQIWLSIPLLVVTGFGFIVMVASGNTLLQTIVEDAKRGRVISFFLMAYFGTTPFGSLAAGAISARIGAPYTLAACGALCLIGVGWFASQLPTLHQDIAPIFHRLGIGGPAADSI
ncbi:MAG TPA: MFS transporter [Vicinamibacterales bacterium]|nr:MFS transporter [Vicinamibacterales bacterium]